MALPEHSSPAARRSWYNAVLWSYARAMPCPCGTNGVYGPTALELKMLAAMPPMSFRPQNPPGKGCPGRLKRWLKTASRGTRSVCTAGRSSIASKYWEAPCLSPEDGYNGTGKMGVLVPESAGGGTERGVCVYTGKARSSTESW
eukprot:3361705-Rhodomonas_salina.1